MSVWLSGLWIAATWRSEEEEARRVALQGCSCQDWDTKHEEAWDWLWSNVEKILGKELGKAAERVPCLVLWSTRSSALVPFYKFVFMQPP